MSRDRRHARRDPRRRHRAGVQRPSTAAVAGLVAVAAIYNNALNLLRPSAPTVEYVVGNTAATAAVVTAGRRMGLDADAMGLSRGQWRSGAMWAARAVATVAAGVAAVATMPATTGLLNDRRADVEPAEFWRWIALRIPLGTVLLEEVTFRGVLYGALAARWSPRTAAAGSSAVFGLWHVVPAVRTLEVNLPDAPPRAKGRAAAGGVAATSLAGIALCVLRMHSGGILAPAAAHVACNVLFATAARQRYQRRSNRSRFMTLSQAATKSRANFSPASSDA